MSAATAALVAVLRDAGSLGEPSPAGLGAWDARALADARLGLFAVAAIDTAAAELERWRASGIDVVSVAEPGGYPASLRECARCAPLLFVRGRLDRDDRTAVAVVGARHADAAALEDAREIAARLADAGRTVVSGLARGIDGAAHEGALAAGGRTYAVLGTGVDRCYPPEHDVLAARIAASAGGALVSEFWPGTGPAPAHFRARNATIAGLANAMVVVDGSQYSGARIAVRHALAAGRRVVLLRRLLEHGWARDLAGRVTVLDRPEEVRSAIS